MQGRVNTDDLQQNINFSAAEQKQDALLQRPPVQLVLLALFYSVLCFQPGCSFVFLIAQTAL